MPAPSLPVAERLAAALEAGLRHELWLTPKPGLVDRRDAGAHPDLTFDLMARSVTLVGGYLGEVAASLRRGEPLAAQVALGQAAEARMLGTLGTNTHRGAIFLGGLLLVARHRASGGEGALRPAVAGVAAELFQGRRLAGSHGDDARRVFGVGGVVGEALGGLPAVFDHALPAWRAARGRGLDEEVAAFAAMAALMEVVEDTTALHRGGAAGLARLKGDGREVTRRLGAGEPVVGHLSALNDQYRAAHLTMGGVADLLGVALGLLVHEGALGPAPRP